MIVIPTTSRNNYLDILDKCDDITGKEPYSGANATIEQIQPFIDFISAYVEKKLIFAKELVAGKIREIDETDKEMQKESIDPSNVSVNVSVKENIVQVIAQFPTITVKELAKMLSVTERTIYRNMNEL